jgi:hypothetical protein
MNSENIYDALTDIREEFIDETKEYKPEKYAKPVVHWCIVAASFILLLGICSYILMNVGLLPPGGKSSTMSGSGNSSNSQSAGTASDDLNGNESSSQRPGGSGDGSNAGGRGSIPHGNSINGGMGWSGSVQQDGSSTFTSYASPVFPLSTLNDASGISVARDITFDFSGFGEEKTAASELSLSLCDILVSDNYTLTNDTINNKSVKIVYPFASNFTRLQKLLPIISVGTDTINTELFAGAYSGSFTGTGPGDANLAVNLKTIAMWADYDALLSDGEYLHRALGDAIQLDQIVTVYEFSNVRSDFSKGEAPTLAASFHLDFDRTKVLTFGFNGTDLDDEEGFMRRSFLYRMRDAPSMVAVIT